MGLRELFTALVALLCLGFGLLLLEQPRTGLDIRPFEIEGTPTTIMQAPRARGPVVVILHGFAGSRALMHPVQLTLARAGYITLSYDLEGHGRNPQPMRGDVTDVEGTTQYLLDELTRVADAARRLPGSDGRLALVGHSMATDLITRLEDVPVEAVVSIAHFSGAVTESHPPNLLILNGALEQRLREEARRLMGAYGLVEGDTAGAPGSDFARRAVAVPGVEHVGVLYAATTLSETLDWLNATFERSESNGLALIGLPILLTLLGLVLIAQPMAQSLAAPVRWGRVAEVPKAAFWALALGPAVLTPLVLRLVETSFLPVLVADYLAVHLAVYGALVLGGLAVEGDLPRMRGWRASIAIAAYGILVVGAVLDRYVGNFMVTGGRWPIFAALLPGAILAMLADATLTQAGQAKPWRRFATRAAFLASLGIAVALDFERLFFLILILPVILLFFLTYGLIGGWVGRRTGSSFAMGVGLGVILAWALAATFPLFEGSGV